LQIELLVFQKKLVGNDVISTNFKSNFDELEGFYSWKNLRNDKFVIRSNNKKPQQK